ncbi:hypothetical protein HRbin36_01536 [bacterium HR36]|nr:hypothetical protein HRbin36_01536 [bacterium HR36]
MLQGEPPGSQTSSLDRSGLGHTLLDELLEREEMSYESA